MVGIVELWDEFLSSRYWDHVLELADTDKHSIIIKFPDLDKFNPDMADQLLSDPEEVLTAANAALQSLDLPFDADLSRAQVRVVQLPNHHKTRELRAEHIGKLISVEGLVRLATEIRPKLISAAFQCQRCGYTFYKDQAGLKFEDQGLKCENEACDRGGPFKLIHAKSKFVDAQRIRLQDSPEDLKGGEQPQTIDVELTEDLTDKVLPGDRVIITGVLKSYQKSSPQTGKSTYFELLHKGVSVEMKEKEFEEIEISPEDEKAIREISRDPQIFQKFIRSIAPSIFGYEDLKLSIALQLMSSPPKKTADGKKVRGDIHILVVGDPGIAKTQFLKYASNLAPRGIFTSGKSSSGAGLTASAVKDEMGGGKWVVEAGVLPMADMGLAAIDELDKMDSKDRNAIHEGMESQTISVAKAGNITVLKSRCSVLAAANPKGGRFDPYEAPTTQINLDPPLMSRFDLIFVIKDTPEKDRDRKIATHITEALCEPENAALPELPPEMLRKYVAYARQNITPYIPKPVREMLVDHYVAIRSSYKGADDPIPATARELEALIRLCEAAARLRLSREVSPEDAILILDLMDRRLKEVGIDPETGKPDISTIDCGTTKTRQDRTRTIIDILKALMKDRGNMVSREAIMERALESGIDELAAEKIMDRLRQEGSLIERRPGFYQLSGV